MNMFIHVSGTGPERPELVRSVELPPLYGRCPLTGRKGRRTRHSHPVSTVKLSSKRQVGMYYETDSTHSGGRVSSNDFFSII